MAKKLYKVGWGFKPGNVEESLKEAIDAMTFPLDKDGTKALSFANVRFERSKSAESVESRKEAMTLGRSTLTRIYSDIVEVENNREKTVARDIHIGSLPQLIEGSGTFIVGGSEYNLNNQLRRKSSAYVFSEKGTTKAAFNLAKGRNFDLSIDPGSGYVVMEIGTSAIPVRPLFESAGLSRMDMVRATSEDFAKEHWDLDNSALLNAYRKLYGKIYEFRKDNYKTFDLNTLMTECKKYMDDSRIDPEITKYLFGNSHDRLDRGMMIDVLKKFYNVVMDKEEGVDQDDLYYQKLFPPNILFRDRLERFVPEIANNIKYKVKLGHAHERIFNDILTKYLVSLVNSSDVSRLDPQYNPLGMYSASTKISPMGMGGIADIQAVARAKRGVHGSYLGVVDPAASPQGVNVGIQLNMTDDVLVDDTGEIYLTLRNKKGDTVSEKLVNLYDKKILLPGQFRKGKGKLYVRYRGKITEAVNPNDYDFELAHGTSSIYNAVNKLVPFPQAVQGNRSFMTSRQITQALPLKYGETPLVEPVDDDGVSTYRKLRKDLESMLPFESPVAGVITKIKDGVISIKQDNGETYKFQYHRHFPFATNTGVDQKPLVKEGDKIKKGQMLVKDAYTTTDGKMAIGVNLKVGYNPYYGDNTEDGVVISEAAADKLTSVHYYTYSTPIDDLHKLNKSDFRKMFGEKWSSLINFDDYDDRGVLKEGKKAVYGNPVILVLEKRIPDDRMGQLGKISKKVILDIIDGSILYSGRGEGTVVDTTDTPRFASVILSTEERAEVGDKVTGMYGNKGTVSRIVPNDVMLRDESGQPIDALFSSTTIVSRINPGQVFENALGNIVKSGKRGVYNVPVAMNPTEQPLAQYVKGEMDKYGIKDKQKVFNPLTGKNIKRPVAVGHSYILKLLKGDKDVSYRGVGPSYTSSGIPAKGGKHGAKSIGAMEFNALVAHNARAFLTDAGNVKGQRNNEYWKSAEMGLSDAVRPQSEAWDKAKSLITAAGGYVSQSDEQISIAPLTDTITNRLAGHRKIETPAMLNSKNLEPMRKGLFDPSVTGGITGTQWAKIQLEDGIISPLMEDYVRAVLGKSKEEYKEWQVNNTTAQLRKDLAAVDTGKVIKELTEKSKTRNLSNTEIKVLRFLKNLKDTGTDLRELVVTAIPVPPPVHRPVTKLDNGSIQIADINLFYKDIMLANEALKKTKGTSFGKESKAVLLDNIGAMVGTSETKNIQLKKKNTRGLLSYLGGVGSPKNGFIHGTLLKKNQDMSGRARIIPEAKMSMDEIGVPEEIAWGIFEPHITRKLGGIGITPIEAAKLIKDRDPKARRAMEDVAGNINIFYNRAPTLHRQSFLAGKPVIVSGDSIKLNLVATNPLNADFDGDNVQLHVPSNNQVSKSLEQYLPSKMIYDDTAPGDLMLKLHAEAVLGLYAMSMEDPAQFRKDIQEIAGKSIPVPVPMTKKTGKAFFAAFAEKHPDKVGDVFDKIRHLGEKYSTEIGSTVGVDDVMPMIKERDALIRKYSVALRKAGNDPKEKIKVLQQMQKESVVIAATHPGQLSDMVKSGAKGSDMQLANIVVSPVIAYDPDNPLATAELTPSSYSEGLSVRDFWLQNAKTRKDLVGTALNVAVPGALGKLMTYNVMREVISMRDCGTDNGIKVMWNSPDIRGRVLQENIGSLKKGTVINPDNINKLPKRDILVRSPLRCQAPEGICQLCFGTDSSWKFYDIGTHVGTRAAQTVTEPLSQKALDSKHGGRDITKDVGKGGLEALQNLFSSDSTKPGVATLAEESGVVTDVEEKKGAFFRIIMDTGKIYKVHPESVILVTKGSRVNKGDKITDGITPYTDVTRLKGTNAGRESLKTSLIQLLGPNGGGIHSRLPETIAKGAVNFVEVLSAFGTYLPGDTITYNKVIDMGIKTGIPYRIDEVPEGRTLAEEVIDLSAGMPLSAEDITAIRNAGVKTVRLFPEDVRLQPVVKSFYTSGMLEDDFVANLAQKYIKKTLSTAAAEGKTSPVVSSSPINKWLRGAPFNQSGAKY